MTKYYYLKKDELIQEGDEVDASNGGWHDQPQWRKTNLAGSTAPDPLYPSHRRYRRKIK